MYKLLFVALISAVAALAQQPAADGARLEGHVRDRDGKPVRKAGLTLRRMDSGVPQPIYAAISDDAGGYSFSDVKPGTYSLIVERAGYLRAGFRPSPNETSSRIIVGAGEQMRGVDVTLRRGGSVSGRVLDEHGDPVASVQVRVLRWTYGTGANLMGERSVVTDDSGRYQTPYLEPGPIYLSAGPDIGMLFSVFGMRAASEMGQELRPTPGAPPEYYATTFYPGGPKQADARPIQIADDDIQGLDFHLHKTPAFLVRGKVTGIIPGYPLEKCQAMLRPVDLPFNGMGGTSEGARALVTKDGTFEFRQVHFPPGEYYLTAVAGTNHPSTQLAVQRLTIRDRDIDDAVLNLRPLVEVRGTISMEGQQHTDFSVLPGIPPPSVTIRVWLSAVDGPPKGYIPVPIKADGSFTIADIAPGIYDVNMSGIFGLWMKSIRMGSVDAVDGRIEITNANGTAPLEITLSRSVSQIAGLVTGAGGSPAAFSTVVVLMEPPRSGGMSATTGTDKNGRFSATNLRPGSYRVYAFEDIAEAQRYDLAILKAAEANSLKVTLKENESAEVTLRQIPAAPLR